MKVTKKLISIFLSSFILLPNVCAMRSSISMPENLCRYIRSEEDAAKDSLYELYRDCNRIIMESSHVPIDKTIDDTAYVCIKTFRRIKDLLYNYDLPSDYCYVAGLLNYIPIIEKINYIISDIMLDKNSSILIFFTPSPTTKSNLDSSIFMLSSIIKRYEQIFWIELQTTFPEPSKAQQIYDLMYNTWDCIWDISHLNSIRD